MKPYVTVTYVWLMSSILDILLSIWFVHSIYNKAEIFAEKKSIWYYKSGELVVKIRAFIRQYLLIKTSYIL